MIVLEPCYDSYVPAIELSGATPVFVPLQFPTTASIGTRVRAAITPRTRMIMINSPHNPAGAVLTPADIVSLIELVERHADPDPRSDEVYEHIIFDGVASRELRASRRARRRAFIVGSFGKTYHTTGWKVGYVVAPAALTAEFRKVHQFVTFSTNTPVQHAIADFLETRRGLAELGPFFQAKRDLFLRLMAGSRFRPLACRGSYFQLMDYSAISDERDPDFAIRLTKEHGVASIPTSPFLRVQPRPRSALLLREAR